MIRLLTLILFCFISFISFAQFSMSNQTVYECYGTLTDSEANSLNAGWYDHNESSHVSPPIISRVHPRISFTGNIDGNAV